MTKTYLQFLWISDMYWLLLTFKHQPISSLWMGWLFYTRPKDSSSHILNGDVGKSEGFTNFNNQLYKLQHKHKQYLSHCWIPNRLASSPHGYFPISRPRTEGPTQAISSLWLVMMDPCLPLRSRHCGTRRAILGLGSRIECVLG